MLRRLGGTSYPLGGALYISQLKPIGWIKDETDQTSTSIELNKNLHQWQVCFVWLSWLEWGESPQKFSAAVSQLSDGSSLGALGNLWHTRSQSYVADCLFRQLLALYLGQVLLQLNLRDIWCASLQGKKSSRTDWVLLNVYFPLFSQGPTFHANLLCGISSRTVAGWATLYLRMDIDFTAAGFKENSSCKVQFFQWPLACRWWIGAWAAAFNRASSPSRLA